MNPIIYDFKRSFLRLSVILILIIFVIGGVFLAYASYKSALPYPAAAYNLNAIAVNYNGKTMGYVFNNQGNPVPNAKVIYDGNVAYTNSSGYFVINSTVPSLTVSYDGEEKDLTFLLGVAYNISEFYNFLGEGVLVTGYNGSYGKVISIIPSPTLYFYDQSGKIIGNFTAPSSTSTIEVFEAPIPKGTFFITVNQEVQVTSFLNLTAVSKLVLFTPLPKAEYLLSTSIVEDVEFISLAFIFLFIYVAFQMFGKLKERGLPLLLARPITRGELYFSRYFSGVLAIFVATVVFTLAVSLTVTTLFKFLPTAIIPALIAYSFFDVVVWYSLSFLFYSKLSPTAGLGVSIAAWFVVYITLEFSALFYPSIANDLTYYVSPTSIATIFANYLVTFSLPSNVILPLSVVDELLWISVPVILGYLIFKKMDV